MQNAPVPFSPAQLATPSQLSEATEAVARRALADGTRALYRSIAAKLDQWLSARGWAASDTSIAEFLVHEHERGLSPGTVALIPAAVRYASKMAGRDNPIGPQCKRVLAGIRREGAGRGVGQVEGAWRGAKPKRVAAVRAGRRARPACTSGTRRWCGSRPTRC